MFRRKVIFNLGIVRKNKDRMNYKEYGKYACEDDLSFLQKEFHGLLVVNLTLKSTKTTLKKLNFEFSPNEMQGNRAFNGIRSGGCGPCGCQRAVRLFVG